MLALPILILLIICSGLNYGKEAALILARGGSKGLRLKNLQKVGGVTLISRAIFTAKYVLNDVTVSTDHPIIALESIKHGATVFRRSQITATDWAPSIWGAAEFLANRPDVEILILIQATSPFIKSIHLKNAIKKIKVKNLDCIFSVSRSYKLRWRYFNSNVLPENFKLHNRPRRQDWNGELIETGAFYLSKRHLINNGVFQNENCSVIEVSPIESLEVDSPDDLKIANALLSFNLT